MMVDEGNDDGGVQPSEVSIQIHHGGGSEPHHLQIQQQPVAVISVQEQQKHPKQKPPIQKRHHKMGEEFTVAGEKTTGDVPTGSQLNLTERDPERINQHLKVAFEEIFAEPHPTIYSFDFIWRISFQAFTIVKLWTYRIITLLLAIPVAAIWAIVFAFLAFIYIWFLVPFYRIFLIICVLIQKFLAALMDCAVMPLTLAVGHCFANIKVTVVSKAGHEYQQV